MAIEIPYKPKGTPTEEYLSYDGMKFKTVTWKVPDDVEYKGKIIYVHGFAEHSSIYTEFFDKLSQQGYEVFFFDQRGSGETGGKTEEHYVFSDLDFMIKRNLDMRKSASEKFFLMGHSMGGGIVLNYGIKGKYIENIKAIVACGPLVRLHPNTEPNIVLRTLSPLINKLLPGFKIDSKLNYDYITSNKRWKDYIKGHDGKLVGTARQFYDMFARGEALLNKDYVSKFHPDTSLMIVHGENDSINWIKYTKAFYDLLNNNIDKEFNPIKGAVHSLFIERDEIMSVVFEKVVTFLGKH